MKNFFKEFKAFITKGNILGMAVGVIIGGAFGAIVTALTQKILMPIINAVLSYITGGNGLYTILWASQMKYSATEAANLASDVDVSALLLGPDGALYTKLFYIDWSAFIEAVINFFFVALTLFIIVKIAMSVAKKRQQLREAMEAKKKAAEAPAEEPAPAPEPEPTPDPVVVLLTEIRDQLKDQNGRIEKLEEKAE